MRPSKTPPLVQEQPASTRPIGTAWLRLGWEAWHHRTQGVHASRRQRPRQAGGTDSERPRGEGIPSVAPRKQIPLKTSNQSVDQSTHGAMTHSFTVHVHVHELVLTLIPKTSQQTSSWSAGVLCRQSDRSGLCATPPPWDPSPLTSIPYIQPLSPVVTFPLILLLLLATTFDTSALPATGFFRPTRITHSLIKLVRCCNNSENWTPDHSTSLDYPNSKVPALLLLTSPVTA